MKITRLIEMVEKGEVSLELTASKKLCDDFFEGVVWQDIKKVILELVVKERTLMECADGEDYKQKIIMSQGALSAFRDVLNMQVHLDTLRKEGEEDDRTEQSTS